MDAPSFQFRVVCEFKSKYPVEQISFEMNRWYGILTVPAEDAEELTRIEGLKLVPLSAADADEYRKKKTHGLNSSQPLFPLAESAPSRAAIAQPAPAELPTKPTSGGGISVEDAIKLIQVKPPE